MSDIKDTELPREVRELMELFAKRPSNANKQYTSMLELIKRETDKARCNEVGMINMGDVEYPRKRLEQLKQQQGEGK